MPFTYKEIFKRAWDSIKDRLPLVTGLTLLYLIAAGTCMMVPFIGHLLGALLSPGYVNCLAKIRRHQEISFVDFFWIFQNLNRLIQFILFEAILVALLVGGFILLIIPGIYISVRLFLASTYFILRNADAMEAIGTSWRLTRSHWWPIAGVMLICLMVLLAGFLCFGLGVLISLPLTTLMCIEILETLENNPYSPVETRIIL